MILICLTSFAFDTQFYGILCLTSPSLQQHGGPKYNHFKWLLFALKIPYLFAHYVSNKLTHQKHPVDSITK